MSPAFLCIFGHEWKIVSCTGSQRCNMLSQSQYSVTDVVWVCNVCQKVRSKEVVGKLTMEDL